MKNLESSISDFLAFEKNRGVFHKGREGILRDMVAFLRKNKEKHINTSTVRQYLTLQRKVSLSTKHLKLSMIRSFARFRILTDPLTEIPSSKILPIERSTFSPHIYTAKNFARIQRESCEKAGENAFAHLSQWAVIGLIRVAGLRCGEACRLSIRDINLTEGIIRVRNAKNMRERIIPIHPKTNIVLSAYLKRRLEIDRPSEDAPFFCSMRGTALRPGEILRKFQVSLVKHKIMNVAGRPPRVHDLRHSFATDVVARYDKMSRDTNAMLPILSETLGHRHIRDTYEYTSFSPSIQKNAVARLNSKFNENK
jgi:integrase/recombinase XerD